MRANIKDYAYISGQTEGIDQAFKNAVRYGNVRLGDDRIFWRKGFGWYVVCFDCIERVYRRVEEVASKTCCGNVNFDTEKLMLVLKSGEILEARVGDGTKREAEELFAAVKESHPELKFGKEN